MCGVLKFLSANAYVIETACVTTAVPAVMQVNWRCESIFLPGQLEGFSMTLG